LNLYHHSRVAPRCSSVSRTHTVHHNLLLIRSSRNHESTRTHTERVNATSVNLCHHRVLSSRQPSAPTLFIMVLYLVNQLRRMLQSHTYGDTLCLNLNLSLCQIPIYIARRVSRSQYNGAIKLVLAVRCWVLANSFYTYHLTSITQNQTCHARLKVHLSATPYDGVTHSLDNLWQSVCSDMRMSISQNSRRCTMLTEHVQNLFDVSTLFRASVQLTVRVSTCTTLSEAIIALGIYLLRTADVSQILFALVHVLTTLQHNRTQSKLDKSQSSKQSTRPCTHNYHLRLTLHIWVFRMLIDIVGRHLVNVCAYLKVHKYLSLSCIYTAFQYSYAVDGPCVQPVFISQVSFQSVFLCCHFGPYSYLVFFNHGAKVITF